METYTYKTTAPFLTVGTVYNCSSYGGGSYNNGTECTASVDGGSAGGSSGGSLVDTGLNIVLPIIIGIVLVVGPIIYFIRRRKLLKK